MPDNHSVALDTIGCNQQATIVKITGSGDLKQRLVDLGLTIGAPIKLIRKSTTYIVKIANTRVGLPKSIVARIVVSL